MRQRRLLVGAAVAAVTAWAVALPASATASDGRAATDVVSRAECRMTEVGGTTVLTGFALAQGPAIDTELFCHVYVNGSQIASVGGTGAGPAAVVAGVVGMKPLGPVTVCAEAYFHYLTGTSHGYWC